MRLGSKKMMNTEIESGSQPIPHQSNLKQESYAFRSVNEDHECENRYPSST